MIINRISHSAQKRCRLPAIASPTLPRILLLCALLKGVCVVAEGTDTSGSDGDSNNNDLIIIIAIVGGALFLCVTSVLCWKCCCTSPSKTDDDTTSMKQDDQSNDAAKVDVVATSSPIPSGSPSPRAKPAEQQPTSPTFPDESESTVTSEPEPEDPFAKFGEKKMPPVEAPHTMVTTKPRNPSIFGSDRRKSLTKPQDGGVAVGIISPDSDSDCERVESLGSTGNSQTFNQPAHKSNSTPTTQGLNGSLHPNSFKRKSSVNSISGHSTPSRTPSDRSPLVGIGFNTNGSNNVSSSSLKRTPSTRSLNATPLGRKGSMSRSPSPRETSLSRPGSTTSSRSTSRSRGVTDTPPPAPLARRASFKTPNTSELLALLAQSKNEPSPGLTRRRSLVEMRATASATDSDASPLGESEEDAARRRLGLGPDDELDEENYVYDNYPLVRVARDLRRQCGDKPCQPRGLKPVDRVLFYIKMHRVTKDSPDGLNLLDWGLIVLPAGKTPPRHIATESFVPQEENMASCTKDRIASDIVQEQVMEELHELGFRETGMGSMMTTVKTRENAMKPVEVAFEYHHSMSHRRRSSGSMSPGMGNNGFNPLVPPTSISIA